MKAIITGSRFWTDEDRILHALVDYGVTHLVEGGARGADRLGREAAIALGIPYTTVPADWDRYSRGAGPKRNQAMLDLHPDAELILAFPLESSIGTRDMMRRSLKAGRRVVEP